MKTILVNHGGIIQPKFIIRTEDDLLEYKEITAKVHGNALTDVSDEQNQIKDAMEVISQARKISRLESAMYMTREKIMAMHKRLLEGHVLVANMAGGWTYWDDKEMSLVEEPVKQTGVKKDNCIDYEINKCECLVLENQEKITDRVMEFLENIPAYSYITNIQFDHNQELVSLIREALKNGCNTIIAESTLQNTDQLSNLVSLFELLPPMNFVLFLYSDLNETLIELIGEERTINLFNKHKITIN